MAGAGLISGRLSAFGVGDGSIRMKCNICGATESVSKNPQCSMPQLLVRAGEFITKHSGCKNGKETRAANIAAGLHRNGEKKVSVWLRPRVKGEVDQSWKAQSQREWQAKQERLRMQA